MLLGFYDRSGSGLAIELTPEMASAIAGRAREIYSLPRIEDVSEIRLSRFAFERLYVFSRYTPKRPYLPDDFFTLPNDEHLIECRHESTGVWIDVEGDEPAVFWEVYDSSNRQNTPYLSLEELDAIANNQPLPTEE
jgi:hypothetical protein